MEERSMECCNSFTKRRKILDGRHSESNKEPNLLVSPNGSRKTNLACLDESHTPFCSAGVSNAEVVAKHDDSFNDGKESLLEGSQIERFDLEQESLKNKNKSVMEGSKWPTNEDSSCKPFATDSGGRNNEPARSEWTTNEDRCKSLVAKWGGGNYEPTRSKWTTNEDSPCKSLGTKWGGRNIEPTRSEWTTNEDRCKSLVTKWGGGNYDPARSKWTTKEDSSCKPWVSKWGGGNYEPARSKWTTNGDSSCKPLGTGWGRRNYEHAREPKASANMNVGCDVYSAKDKASVEASRGSHPIDKLGTSTESKMDATCSFSKLDTIKENASQVRNEENLPPQILDCHSHSRKKLLVLDVNGLLVDIVADPDEAYRADTIIGSKAVFKRPYCNEFLQFCFERFNVGVWTSRTRRNIERVLDFLMRDTQHQLLFCWDQSHCTETGFNTIENSDKPLVLKELKRLWEKQDPNLPWDKGVYDESNTLLLDDSPYKALRNPPYTAIFPNTYCYRDTKDNGLGPEGNLRNYLERLAASDNVQNFIEQNPFGQQPITNNNESWRFYLKVIGAASSEPESDATNSFAAKSSLEVNTESGPSHSNTKTAPSRSRKKLIIFDASGLLVDITSYPREGYRANTVQGFKAVFKRPYCDEFLKFCFERFNVGVWTSTTGRNIERVLDFLMRDTQQKLLFCWDQSHCTDTGFTTVENYNKPLVLKELRRLWEKQDPNLPWDIGDYDESNTLLFEHSPYKTLLNPPHTAIFPYPYRHWHDEDNSLGPEGDLRIYLERLADSENVQKFVEKNPFGQRPITKKNLSWGFYVRVIRATSSNPEAYITNEPEPAQCTTNEPEPTQCTTTSPEPEPTQCTANSTEPEPKPAQCTANSLGPEPEPAQCTSNSLGPEPEPAQCTANSPGPEPAQCTSNSSEPETDTSTTSAAQTLLKLSLANANPPSLDPV